MDDSKPYQVVSLRRFRVSRDKLLKTRYRKDKKARSAFNQLVDSYLECLSSSPVQNHFSDAEPFPNGAYQEGLELRKIRFSMPGLRGLAMFGRLMYAVFEPNSTVFPMWLYTHAEYEKRPSDRELTREIAIIQNHIEELTKDL